jgi:hypothetical protein
LEEGVFSVSNERKTTMNKPLAKFAAVSLLALAGAAAHAQVGIGASITINQPGVYGRVDFGPQPGYVEAPPALIYPQPVIVQPGRVAYQQRPIYLYVPEPYTHDWVHHCAAYRACGQPVYFVRDQWVRDRWAQHYPHGRDFGHGPDRGGWHGGDRHDDHRDRDDHGRDDHGRGDHGHDGDRR